MMKQLISVGIITTNKWKYFHLFSQVRDMPFNFSNDLFDWKSALHK